MADTSLPVTATAPAVILVEPQLGENIGTTAKTMPNFVSLWNQMLGIA